MVCKTMTAAAPNKNHHTLLERATTVIRMREQRLSLKWVNEFTLQELLDCCDRIGDRFSGVNIFTDELQKELICNPAFTAYYADLLDMLPEDPTEEMPKPEQCTDSSYSRYSRNSSRYTPAPTPAASLKPPSRRSTIVKRLSEFLGVCWENGCAATDFAKQDLIDAMDSGGWTATTGWCSLKTSPN